MGAELACRAASLGDCPAAMNPCIRRRVCTSASVNRRWPPALIALAKAGPSLGLEGLIRDWEITQGEDDAEGHKQWRRGTQRWVSVLTIRVSMYLARERLVSFC